MSNNLARTETKVNTNVSEQKPYKSSRELFLEIREAELNQTLINLKTERKTK
jgi:hypothetical protein